MFNQAPIYLDHSATTPVHPQVVEAMLPIWTENYGNPSSVHQQGRRALRALEEARASIAERLGARIGEIIFTGCGSESDNLALRGVMLAAQRDGRGNHIITSRIEHKAVLETVEQLCALHGFEATLLDVDGYGRVDPQDARAAIRPDTVLISIMAANNEIGTLQPIDAIGRIAQEHDVLFHSDAVQMISSAEWNLSQMPIDLLSIAPHKFGGPKGIGILYAREGVEIVAPMTGGGQEDGRRPGTQNVAFAVGAAKALEITQNEREQRVAEDRLLRDRLIEQTLARLGDDCRLTGHPHDRLPFHASFALRNLRGNDLLMHLDLAGVCASSGSACSVGNPKPSPVLEALGLDEQWTRGGLRFTVGDNNDAGQIDRAVDALVGAVERLQRYTLQYS